MARPSSEWIVLSPSNSSSPSLLRTSRSTQYLTYLAICSGFAQFLVVVSLGEVAKRFGHPSFGHSYKDITGLSGSTTAIALAILRLASLAALPLASLADRWGRKTVVRRVATLGLAVTALAAGSSSFWIFIALCVVARPLLSTTSTVVSVIAVELASANTRMYRVAWVTSGLGVGAGLAAICHGLLPGPDAFRYLFAATAALALLVAPLLRRVNEPPVGVSVESHLKARLGVIPHEYRRQMVLIALLTVVVGLISGPANGLAFDYAENVLGISRHEVSLVVTLSALTAGLGLIAGIKISNRFGRRWTIGLGVAVTALTSTLAYSGGRPSFIVGYMCGVFGSTLFGLAGMAWTNEIFPHAIRATAAGWVVVAGVLGGISGLLIFGLVTDAVHASSILTSSRIPAAVTFLPALPVLLVLRLLPETRGSEID